jgi:hypothetical protein
MNSFWKGFCNLFGCFSPKTLDESMEDLYSRMGWGQYHNPCESYNTSVDINRALEQQEFSDTIKDPSRPRISQCYGRQRCK